MNVNFYVNECAHPHNSLRWAIGPVSEQHFPHGPVENLMLQLTDTQKVALGPITFTNKKGNPAQVQSGSIAWSSSDPTVAAITASADGTAASVVAGAAGTAQVSVTADADLGDGVGTITGTLDVTVVAGPAVGITIPTGTPEEQ